MGCTIHKEKAVRLLQEILILEWLALLWRTDAKYSCYLILGLLALVLTERGQKRTNLRLSERVVINALAAFLSALIMIANYEIIETILIGFLCIGGGFVVWRRCLLELYDRMTLKRISGGSLENDLSRRVFFYVFAGCSVIYMSVLLLANYPGVLSPDSVNQLDQVVSGVYSNHHPYWHTRLIGLFVHPCMAMFNSAELGILAYCIAQILMMAGCFAFAVMTAYQAGVRIQYVMVMGAFYMLAPYHILYSFTVWKDILFGGSVLLLVASLYRICRNIGGGILNYAVFLTGAIGMALLRNNGWIALATTFVLWVLFFRRRQVAVIVIFVAVLAVSWVMCNPVLEKKGVTPGNYRESLSIPIQQIARVLVEDGDVTDEQKELINRVIPVDWVPQLYDEQISDPVKFNVDGEYIRENKAAYLKLWLEIGDRNTKTYCKALIESTKGYWNAGYNYWILGRGVYPNEHGVSRTVFSVPVDNLMMEYADTFERLGLSIPLCSIGMCVWTMGILMVFNALRGQKALAFLAVPVLMIIGTLIIASPVFSEFRYAYAVFTVLPMYVSLSLFAKDT